MEIIQISYSIVFFTFFFCFFFSFIHKLSSSKKPIKTLPPGPWKLPLIGNLHQLIAGSSLPHRSLTNLANKYGPFMHLQLGQVSHMIISSPEHAKEIMKTHDQIFANRPRILASDILAYNGKDIVFSPYGNYWRQLRKICTLQIFSAKRVQSFRKIREEEVSELVRSISEHEGSLMNLSRKIFPLTSSIATRTTLGKKTKNVEFISAITGLRNRMMKLQKDADKVFDDIIEDHKEKKRNNNNNVVEAEEEEDLVDVLVRIQKDNDFEIPLSLDNIKAVLKDVFFAGTETTASFYNFIIRALNPVMKLINFNETQRL